METDARFTLADFFLVPFRLKTWASVLYLWLAFPLGLVYFVTLFVGFTTGIALTIVWVGLLVLFVTLLFAEGAERVEAFLARALAGARPGAPLAAVAPKGGFRAWFAATFVRPRFWKGLAFLFLRFPLGLAGWALSLVTLTVSAAFFTAPILTLFGIGEISYDFDPLPFLPPGPVGLFLLWLAGAFGLLLTLHFHNGLAWLWARLAEWLLEERPAEPTAAPAAPAPTPQPAAA